MPNGGNKTRQPDRRHQRRARPDADRRHLERRIALEIRPLRHKEQAGGQGREQHQGDAIAPFEAAALTERDDSNAGKADEGAQPAEKSQPFAQQDGAEQGHAHRRKGDDQHRGARRDGLLPEGERDLIGPDAQEPQAQNGGEIAKPGQLHFRDQRPHRQTGRGDQEAQQHQIARRIPGQRRPDAGKGDAQSTRLIAVAANALVFWLRVTPLPRFESPLPR